MVTSSFPSLTPFSPPARSSSSSVDAARLVSHVAVEGAFFFFFASPHCVRCVWTSVQRK